MLGALRHLVFHKRNNITSNRDVGHKMSALTDAQLPAGGV